VLISITACKSKKSWQAQIQVSAMIENVKRLQNFLSELRTFQLFITGYEPWHTAQSFYPYCKYAVSTNLIPFYWHLK
jgi:hypothetical protein